MEICLDGEGLSMAFGPHFKRLNNSLRKGSKRFTSRRGRPSSVMSNPDLPKNDSDGSASRDNGQECSAQSWAVSFERLLEDPEGVKAFAEFLKKEFSSENIDFWISVERFRQLPNGPEKKSEARRIFREHISVGAEEAVNVDAQGRQCAELALQEAPSNMFDQAQKQVLNLMKFDSYPRFLKSELYKMCLANSAKTSSSIPKLKKSLSNAEDRRRKIILPWHRKSRSKSKDRSENGESTLPRLEDISSKNEIHSSRSSLTSLDLALVNNSQKDDSLCRVILGNCSTTVIQINPSESVQDLVHRLLEKRGLSYSSFEVYTDKHAKPVDINEASTILARCEVRIQQRVVFKLDLPNRKTVSVKSKATKMIVDVLKPILHKYEYTLDQVVVINPKDVGSFIDIKQPITTIDGLKLQVQLIDKKLNNISEPRLVRKLDEITNRVFEGILQEKSENSLAKTKSDRGSVKSEDLGSDHSSSYFGKFLRKDSTHQDWKKKSLIPRRKLLTDDISKIVTTPEQYTTKNKPLITKLTAGVKLQVSPCSESECNELVEGLTRAQKSRLEDQRGTEINFELPDFLKDKENDRKLRKASHHSIEDSNRSFLVNNPENEITSSIAIPIKTKNFDQSPNYENQSVRNKEDDSPVNTPSKQIKLNISSTHSQRPSAEKSNVKSSQLTVGSISRSGNTENRSSSPPPLPPKPKIVPLRAPNWGQKDFQRPKVSQNIQNRQSLFLEQSSSSFV